MSFFSSIAHVLDPITSYSVDATKATEKLVEVVTPLFKKDKQEDQAASVDATSLSPDVSATTEPTPAAATSYAPATGYATMNAPAAGSVTPGGIDPLMIYGGAGIIIVGIILFLKSKKG